MRVSLLFVLALCVALSVGDQVQSFKPAGLNPPPDVNTIFIFGSNLAFGTDNGQYTFPATPTFTPTQMTYRFTAQLKANLETLYKHTIEVVDLSIWDGRIEQITAQIAKVTGTRTGSSLVIIDYLHNYLLDIILGKDDTQYYSQPINGIPRSGGLWQTAYTEAQRQAQVAKLYGRVASVPLQDKQQGLTGTSFQNFQTRIRNAVAAINAQVNAQTGGPFGKSVQFWMVNAFDPFAGLGRIYKAPSDIISTQFAYKDMNPVAEAIPFAYHVWNVMLAELAGSISAGVLDAYGLFSTRTLGSAVPGAEDFVSVTRPVLTSSTDPLVPNQTGHTALATLATASITTNVPAVNVDANGGATAATTVADGSGSTAGSGSGSGSTTSTSPTTSITLSFGGMFSGVTA